MSDWPYQNGRGGSSPRKANPLLTLLVRQQNPPPPPVSRPAFAPPTYYGQLRTTYYQLPPPRPTYAPSYALPLAPYYRTTAAYHQPAIPTRYEPVVRVRADAAAFQAARPINSTPLVLPRTSPPPVIRSQVVMPSSDAEAPLNHSKSADHGMLGRTNFDDDDDEDDGPTRRRGTPDFAASSTQHTSLSDDLLSSGGDDTPSNDESFIYPSPSAALVEPEMDEDRSDRSSSSSNSSSFSSISGSNSPDHFGTWVPLNDKPKSKTLIQKDESLTVWSARQKKLMVPSRRTDEKKPDQQPPQGKKKSKRRSRSGFAERVFEHYMRGGTVATDATKKITPGENENRAFMHSPNASRVTDDADIMLQPSASPDPSPSGPVIKETEIQMSLYDRNVDRTPMPPAALEDDHHTREVVKDTQTIVANVALADEIEAELLQAESISSNEYVSQMRREADRLRKEADLKMAKTLRALEGSKKEVVKTRLGCLSSLVSADKTFEYLTVGTHGTVSVALRIDHIGIMDPKFIEKIKRPSLIYAIVRLGSVELNCRFSESPWDPEELKALVVSESKDETITGGVMWMDTFNFPYLNEKFISVAIRLKELSVPSSDSNQTDHFLGAVRIDLESVVLSKSTQLLQHIPMFATGDSQFCCATITLIPSSEVVAVPYISLKAREMDPESAALAVELRKSFLESRHSSEEGPAELIPLLPSDGKSDETEPPGQAECLPSDEQPATPEVRMFGPEVLDTPGVPQFIDESEQRNKADSEPQGEADSEQQSEAGGEQQSEAGVKQQGEAGDEQQSEAGGEQQSEAGGEQQSEAGGEHQSEAGGERQTSSDEGNVLPNQPLPLGPPSPRQIAEEVVLSDHSASKTSPHKLEIGSESEEGKKLTAVQSEPAPAMCEESDYSKVEHEESDYSKAEPSPAVTTDYDMSPAARSDYEQSANSSPQGIYEYGTAVPKLEVERFDTQSDSHQQITEQFEEQETDRGEDVEREESPKSSLSPEINDESSVRKALRAISFKNLSLLNSDAIAVKVYLVGLRGLKMGVRTRKARLKVTCTIVGRNNQNISSETTASKKVEIQTTRKNRLFAYIDFHSASVLPFNPDQSVSLRFELYDDAAGSLVGTAELSMTGILMTTKTGSVQGHKIELFNASKKRISFLSCGLKIIEDQAELNELESMRRTIGDMLTRSSIIKIQSMKFAHGSNIRSRTWPPKGCVVVIEKCTNLMLPGIDPEMLRPYVVIKIGKYEARTIVGCGADYRWNVQGSKFAFYFHDEPPLLDSSSLLTLECYHKDDSGDPFIGVSLLPLIDLKGFETDTFVGNVKVHNHHHQHSPPTLTITIVLET